jgi:hypothetical protein
LETRRFLELWNSGIQEHDTLEACDTGTLQPFLQAEVVGVVAEDGDVSGKKSHVVSALVHHHGGRVFTSGERVHHNRGGRIALGDAARRT